MIKNPGFTIGRHDRREPLERILKGSNGLPADLTSVTTVKFHMVASDGSTKVNAVAEIVAPATDGHVRYSWGPTDTDTAGYFKAEWEVTYSDATPETFPNDGPFIVHVKEDLL